MCEIINQGRRETKKMRAHSRLHGDASFELFDDVARLFLLVPANESIEHKNSNLSPHAEQKESDPGK